MTISNGVTIYIGLQASTIQGEIDDLGGPRMYTAAYRPKLTKSNCNPARHFNYLLDSGAFTDSPEARLNYEQALDRQLGWEKRTSEVAGRWLPAFGFVSYDLLIDETWVSGKKEKRRWSVRRADWAVNETVSAASYLAGQRERLAPRKLILSAQGVDSIQYAECASEVLKVASPADWFGLGGWCIIGRMPSLLPEFWRTLYQVLPMVKQAGVSHVHIFGVNYLPALGGLLYLADKEDLTVSTDSTKPIKDCLWKLPEARRKAGCRVESGYWKDNVSWWKNTLATLRDTKYYKRPLVFNPARQLELFEDLEVA